MPSNALKEWRGTRADFQKNKAKMEGEVYGYYTSMSASRFMPILFRVTPPHKQVFRQTRYYHTKMQGRFLSEADLRSYFSVSLPAVHQRVLSLGELRFIKRLRGRDCLLRLLLCREQIPNFL